MFRARIRSAYRIHGAGSEAAPLGVNTALLLGGTSTSNCTAAAAAALLDQKRYSFKYARKPQHVEMRQPTYVNDKRNGVFSNERNIAKSRRGLPFVTPLYTKHMSLWETDTDASTNRFFRNYVFGQRELHLLLGRPHGFEADEAGGKQGDSAYEISTDMRYKGVPRPAITNLHYEPMWNRTLYREASHGAQLTDPRSPVTAEILGSELMQVRDIKSLEHCKAWFDRLQYLIQLHYDAVGDIGEFKSRHTQHVHQFFVSFHDALSSFDFQDSYLLEHFKQVRPKELADIFGTFIEMESNYVNTDYCPRCSLPYATTRFCGEGDVDTPFRKHRGRWAPHQHWGKEWFDVVTRRAEALWYRATEDPYFGTEYHTQKQVVALLNVYAKTRQREKAIDFMNRLRGSQEYLTGRITMTDDMQHTLDHLLDTTPHQHLLTNSFQLQSRASIYTGETNKVPLSPLQMRLDLEMNRFRRQQKEEGVVRVPPATWKIDTSAIVPYKLDKNKQVTNWREVKAGIEHSFLSTGLPREAYTSQEWREMLRVQEKIATRAERRAMLEEQRRADEAKFNLSRAGGTLSDGSSNTNAVVFPDKSWYRVFETSAAALKPFGVSSSGVVFTATTSTFPDPALVPYTNTTAGRTAMKLDTTTEACQLYGDFESGDVLRVVEAAAETLDGSKAQAGKGITYEVVVVGVDKEGPESGWALVVMPTSASQRAECGLIELGKDCADIQERFSSVEFTGRRAIVDVLEDQRTVKEEFLGQVVGVRGGQLYVQWRLLRGGGSALDRSVAVPLGDAAHVKQYYNIRELNVEPLVESPSWRTPFRNDFADERLKELKEAPFSREKWASLIKGKYTPKVKKFGYTQHTTQDDFETKEYKDRLLAKQFFTDPQAFEVIPERRERSVKFDGKWEYTRTHGVPTVDRNELENGWGEVEPITDSEMHVIEQALRDISGRRPGNFIKSPTETQSLQLNESWWAPLDFGWEEHNREQKAFVDSSEQQLIENARLPFGGKIPPFGTTYGIGERIREIAADYAKGFGIGPHGHSPTHDTTHFNTLGSEEARVKTLGLGNPLVRIFNEKLGTQDIHAWALHQCNGSEVANVRHLLLSVQEWREKGRAPSVLLAKVLDRYLKDELTSFNNGLPDNVPRLAVMAGAEAAATNSSSHSGSGDASQQQLQQQSNGNIWASVDRTQYGYECAKLYNRGDADEVYIIGLVQRAKLEGKANFSDVGYSSFLQQNLLSQFHLELAKIVGKGIAPSFISQKTSAQHRGMARSSGNVTPFVRVSELAKLLAKMQVSSQNISIVVRGLANCPEHEPLGADDFVIPVSLVFAWSGPTGSSGGPSSTGGSGASSSSMSAVLNRSGGSGRGGNDDNKMVVHVLEEMALRDDGRFMDIQYAIRENKLNSALRQEFLNAFLPVFNKDLKKVSQLYEDYCHGKYVPNITVAVEAFIVFLANISQHPEALASAAVDYFEVDSTGRYPGQYVQVKLLPTETGPFKFESTLAEAIKTAEVFHKYGILAGPTRVSTTGFIAANSKSLNYVANRADEVVYVTTQNDQGLHATLRKSAHFKTISANPALRFLLNSPSGAGLVASFNRFFYRVVPMLTFYQDILNEYVKAAPALRYEAQNANLGLTRALEGELSPSIEQEFRRNAERYWRNVLEGRNVEESSMMGGSGRQGGQSFGGDRGGRRLLDGGQRGGNRSRSGGSAAGGKVDLDRALGQQQQHETGAAASAERRPLSGQATSGGSASGGSRTMSSLLDKLKTAQPTGGDRGRAGGASRKPRGGGSAGPVRK